MFPKIDVKSKKKKIDVSSDKLSIKRKPSYKLERKNLNVKAVVADLEVEWYSEDSKKSKHLDNEFTNFVEDFLTDIEIENGIDVLNDDLENLKDNNLPPVDIPYNEKGQRLKDIIELYFTIDNSHEDYWFVKTDINTEFQTLTNRRSSFRVIMVNMKDMENNKHFLQILFLDPHHLFIPGGHNGKTAEQTKNDTYRSCRNYDTCISEYLN